MTPKIAAEQNIENLHETVIKKHSFFPFWVFADLMSEPHEPVYWCFLGANYPAGLVSGDTKLYNVAIDELTSGRWLLRAKTDESDKNKKIGFGYDATPSNAFIEACKMAGVIK